MTTRFTHQEWLEIFKRAQQSIPQGKSVYPTPGLATAEFAKYIDHTLLKLDATKEQIDQLCAEARTYDFKVGINSTLADPWGAQNYVYFFYT